MEYLILSGFVLTVAAMILTPFIANAQAKRICDRNGWNNPQECGEGGE